MTLDRQVELARQVELEQLRVQRNRWGLKLCMNSLFGAGYMTVGAFSVGIPLTIGINRIAKNIAYSAIGSISENNIDIFVQPPEIPAIAGFALGGLMFGFGVYHAVRGAMAAHKADELADRIAEIESSPQYKAQQAQPTAKQ